MANLDDYRNYIRQIIAEYGQYKPAYGEVAMQTIFDAEHDHYQLFSVGWNKYERIHGCVMHMDIIEGKIWIQHDGTDVGIADELLALGVPKEDIVLAFHPPYKRPYTGFAVN
jgi:hypothetical protein